MIRTFAHRVMRVAAVAMLCTTVRTSPVSAQERLSEEDKAFLAKAVQSNIYEIEAAKLAAWMATDAATKSFATLMDQDHRHLGTQLASIVTAVDSTFVMPTAVDAQGQALLSALRNAGKGFDAVYRDQMIAAHTEAQQAFQRYIASVTANPRIRAVIAQVSPVLQMHLDRAKELLPRQRGR